MFPVASKSHSSTQSSCIHLPHWCCSHSLPVPASSSYELKQVQQMLGSMMSVMSPMFNRLLLDLGSPDEGPGVASWSGACGSAGSFCRLHSICALLFYFLAFTLSRFLAFSSTWRFFSSAFRFLSTTSLVLLPYASVLPVVSFSPLSLTLLFLLSRLLFFSPTWGTNTSFLLILEHLYPW